MISAEFVENKKNTYAGWWYCVIPIKYIRKDNLPLPLFVRSDDVEFAIRNNAKFIVLNGIAVWHNSFVYKYNPVIDNYILNRNNLIIQAGENLQEIQYINVLKRIFLQEIRRFCYDQAELTIMALEDYMKGPEYIMFSNSEEIFKTINNKKVKFKSVVGTEYQSEKVDKNAKNIKRSLIERIIYKFTYNGHLLPNAFLSDEKTMVMYDWSQDPHKNYLKKTLITFNPYENTYNERKMDRKKFSELMKRYKKSINLYKKNNEQIEKKYREKKEIMISYEFWEKYLNL